jgi:hypothetical protein
MEAADDRDAGVSQCAGKIIDLYDHITGAFTRTKEANHASFEDVEIADGRDARTSAFQRSMTYRGWEIQAY